MRDSIFTRFNDIVLLERYKGLNEFNEREFEVSEELKCRLVEDDTIVKKPNQEDVISHFKVYTNVSLEPLDRLNGLDVLRIKEHKSIVDNEVIGYTIFL